MRRRSCDAATDMPCRPQPARNSLQLDLGASLLQLTLELLGLLLADALLDGLGRRLDEVLGFLQPKTGDGADFLDHLDLLVADRREDDRELGLLLDHGGGGTARGGRNG